MARRKRPLQTARCIERRAVDRRIQSVYHEPDRRERERRAHWPQRKLREKRNWWPLVAMLLPGVMLLDALAWHGHYFRQARLAINGSAAETRAWSDNVWK